MPTEVILRRRGLDRDMMAIYRYELMIAKAETEERERIEKEVEENRRKNRV